MQKCWVSVPEKQRGDDELRAASETQPALYISKACYLAYGNVLGAENEQRESSFTQVSIMAMGELQPTSSVFLWIKLGVFSGLGSLLHLPFRQGEKHCALVNIVHRYLAGCWNLTLI